MTKNENITNKTRNDANIQKTLKERVYQITDFLSPTCSELVLGLLGVTASVGLSGILVGLMESEVIPRNNYLWQASAFLPQTALYVSYRISEWLNRNNSIGSSIRDDKVLFRLPNDPYIFDKSSKSDIYPISE